MTQSFNPALAAAPVANLASLAPGFEQPVLAAQQTYRALLDAMARPGRLFSLPPTALQGLPRSEVSPALRAALLTLMDADVLLHLALADTAAAPLAAYLQFHTGVRLTPTLAAADFVALAAADASPTLWTSTRLGSDEAPQDSATLIIDVPSLQPLAQGQALPAGHVALTLRGPGIQTTQRLAVAGLDAAFWQARQACEDLFPRGVDLLLCAGSQVAGLPRSSHILQVE